LYFTIFLPACKYLFSKKQKNFFHFGKNFAFFTRKIKKFENNLKYMLQKSEF